MKKYFLFIALGVFQIIFLNGQTNARSVDVQSKIISDTIVANSKLILDTNITDTRIIRFNATFTRGGISITQTIKGNHFTPSYYGCKSGDIIIVEEIYAKDKTGKKIKLPVRKYVIR